MVSGISFTHEITMAVTVAASRKKPATIGPKNRFLLELETDRNLDKSIYGPLQSWKTKNNQINLKANA